LSKHITLFIIFIILNLCSCAQFKDNTDAVGTFSEAKCLIRQKSYMDEDPFKLTCKCDINNRCTLYRNNAVKLRIN
jgi:hypothetical protein